MRGSLNIRIGSLLTAFVISAALPGYRLLTAGRAEWEPVGLAVLNIDARPAKDWQIYQPDDQDFILVRIGRRYLLLDTEAQQAWELGPEQFRREGQKLVSEEIGKLTAETQSSASQEDSPGNDRLTPSTAENARVPGNPVVRHRWPKRLRTEEWVSRHAGRARLIQVRLADEGRVLEIQLPLNIYEQIRR